MLQVCRRFLRDETGATPALEFVLVLPLLLIVIAIVAQLALLLVAQTVVELAAFQAARAAIVWVPARLEGEPAGRIAPSRSAKLAHVRGAAAITCAVLTPAIAVGVIDGASDTEVRLERPSLLLSTQLARTLTRVRLDRAAYRSDSPVTVTVEHDFVLRIPGAARLLGKTFGALGLRVRTLRASATLTNQGGAPEVRRA
ncbi:MAG: TadE/TadG family type IV pilus assembly protein [Planctomycetota bacterium]